MKISCTIILLLLVTSTLGCQTRGGELAKRSSRLLEGGLSILESHQESPEQAPEAFRVFMEKQQSEIEELSGIATSIADDKAEITTARRIFLEKLKTLQPRLDSIAAAYGSNKALIEEFNQIAEKALRLSP